MTFFTFPLHRLFVVLWLLIFNASIVHATELTFNPQAPSVEIGGKLTLSVSGTSGAVTWTAAKGHIEGTGTQVTYWPPDQVGVDIVSVLDEAGNTGMIKIVILPKTSKPSPDNAIWKVFSNQKWIQILSLSEKSETLWLGTRGGLEQRNAATGQLERLFTTDDGLPNNDILALSRDLSGRLWIGTYGGSLAYLSASDEWTIYNANDIPGLPFNQIKNLSSESNGGLWIGTDIGIANLRGENEWTIYNTNNSKLPNNQIEALLSDSNGGVWIGTQGGLAYLSEENNWKIYNTENSALPDNRVECLLSDSKGGLWIGTYNGLAYLSDDWTIYNTNNSSLPSNYIETLSSDSSGGLWIGTYNGLAYLSHGYEWTIYNTNNSKLPSNAISHIFHLKDRLWIGTYGGGFAYLNNGIVYKPFNYHVGLPHNGIESLSRNGGMWIGTEEGLAYLSKDDKWTVYNKENSNLPDNYIETLSSDSRDGVWIGTFNGLAYRAGSDEWTIYNTDNSILPDNWIKALFSDSSGGVWIGTYNGLAYLAQSDEWTVYNTHNSGLPNNEILALSSDGGLWIGTKGGLAYFSSIDNEWTTYNTDNSSLPNNNVTTLFSETSGGLWIGTENGLAYLSRNGEWTIYNADLPDNRVRALYGDTSGEGGGGGGGGGGGLWIGTQNGLAYRSAEGEWITFNSGLPDKSVREILPDGTGGMWVATTAGLAHLAFGQQQTGNRAAIIITGGPNIETNELWDTATSISNHIYKMLIGRGFVNTEIYYLSPQDWADFNGDGFNDRIVDAPRPQRQLMIEDVRKALDLAKEPGKLDQPLYLFFIGHGGEGKLQLAKFVDLEAAELKALLDDYQAVTGNNVVLVVDACHSGSFMPTLAAENRAVLTSSKAEEKSYFYEKQGWSRFLASRLFQSMHFFDAFNYASSDHEHLLGKKLPGFQENGRTQTPVFDDNGDGVYSQDGQWLKQVKINGNYVTADLTLAVTGLTESASLSVAQAFSLRARASTASGRVERVWAVIRPPKMNLVIDSNGTPILAYPRAMLSPNASEGTLWESSWNEAIYNGDYEITFYAEDNEGNIASSDETVMITVSGGIAPPDSSTVEIVLEKDRYQRGESFQVSLIEHLNWGYDLYAAVVLPDGQFVALSGENEFAPLNQPEKWAALRKQGSPLSLLQLTLPENLATGEYCFYGILSPKNGAVLENIPQWVWTERCFEVF